MTVYDSAVSNVMRAAGVEKTAESNYAQDFLAGMDPFGFWTNQYGMEAERAGVSEGEHALKRGFGTAGGIVGGTALVPSAIYGITEGVKGFSGAKGGLGRRLGGAAKGFMSGAKRPIKSVAQASKAKKGLKDVAEGGKALDDETIDAIKYLSEGGLGSGMFGRGNTNARKFLKGVSTTRQGRAVSRGAAEPISSKLTDAKAQLGLGGAIGGTGAFLQYGAGRESERETDITSRIARGLGFGED